MKKSKYNCTLNISYTNLLLKKGNYNCKLNISYTNLLLKKGNYNCKLNISYTNLLQKKLIIIIYLICNKETTVFPERTVQENRNKIQATNN